jgi:hypothetical protein
MTTMYCPNCKMNVFTVREDLDIGLIIILSIFTAGLGVLIYLAIYYDKDTNRCIHCKSICQPIMVEYQSRKPINLLEVSYKVESGSQASYQAQIEEQNSKFCYNCGIKLDEREGLKFCAYCGTKIN